MKKVSSSLISFIFCLSFAYSQAPSLEWSRCYGGTISDWGEYVFPLQDGGFLVTGSSYSNDGDVSGHHSNGTYLGYDYWVARMKADGTILWQKSFGGTLTDLGRGIVQIDPAHFVISGYAWSNDDDISGNHGDYDLWLMKIDTSGNLIAGKAYGGSQEDDNWDLIETPDHGFIITGATLSSNGDIPFSHGGYEAWVVKVDSLATLEWSKPFGGSNEEYFNQTIPTSDGNYLAVGRTASSDWDVTYNHGGLDMWVVKFDTAGNLLWQKTYGGSANEEAQAVVAAPGGGYLITGFTNSNDQDVSGNHGGSDVWVICIDDSGNLLWQHCYGGTNEETSWGISDVSSQYWISGESWSSDGDVANNYGGKDGWLFGIDGSGSLLWEKNYGGSAEDWMRLTRPSTPGIFYAIGTSGSSNFDAINAHGENDYFILKLRTCLPVSASFGILANGLEVTFTDNSSNATSWYWDFGDGTYSTDQNPVHQYAGNGSYEICLVANDSCSSDTLCQNIKLFVTSANSIQSDHASPEILMNVFPNPFSDFTTIQFSLEKNIQLKLELQDLSGRQIKRLAAGNFIAGEHELILQKENLEAGMFLLQFMAGNHVFIRKIIIQ